MLHSSSTDFHHKKHLKIIEIRRQAGIKVLLFLSHILSYRQPYIQYRRSVQYKMATLDIYRTKECTTTHIPLHLHWHRLTDAT